jgi:lysophospholipase
MLTSLRPTTDNSAPASSIVAVVRTRDGKSLRMARWRPSSRKQRGTVFLLQGRSESIEKYFETISSLRRRGFFVISFDWRGQGGSERLLADPRKGHVEDFEDYVADLSAVLETAEGFAAPKPWFGLAHSMGAAALLLALEMGEKRLQRAVLASPMIGLAGYGNGLLPRVAAFVFDFFGLGGSYIPGGGATSISTRVFETNILTSDPARYARHAAIVGEAPELALGDPTIGWVTAMYRLYARFADPAFGARLAVPTLFVTAGGDRLVSTDAAIHLADRIRASGNITIKGARHELLSESDLYRDQFFAAFDAFIPGTQAMDDIAEDAEAA